LPCFSPSSSPPVTRGPTPISGIARWWVTRPSRSVSLPARSCSPSRPAGSRPGPRWGSMRPTVRSPRGSGWWAG